MDINNIYSFLNRLAANNNREWFMAHKDEYDYAKNLFDIFTASLIDRISIFDSNVKGMQPSQCTYRIYRDVRFSEDKTPYKTHMGAYINPHGKKATHCGYYIHLQPDNSMLCIGSICWPTNILKAVRQSIVDNIDEYIGIVENQEFKKYYPIIGDSRLMTSPKGFSKDYKYIEYIKPKDYSCAYKVPDKFFTENQETLMDRIEDTLSVAKPFVNFINLAIDEFNE